MPVNSCLLLEAADEARYFPRGDLVLAFCEDCGFVFNQVFDPARSEYSTRYEETQGFSPHFRQFARELASRWIERHDLRRRQLVEIGCGKGEFLALLCELGDNSGVGIDPSFRPDRMDEGRFDGRLRFIQDVYREEHRELGGDAVICRHTLEHISDTGRFLDGVRRSVEGRPDTAVLFELPDARRVIDEAAFWDVYYEHCSYFTAGSLARLFRRTDFTVTDLSLEYGGQYLVLDARPGRDDQAAPLPIEEDVAELSASVDAFEPRVEACRRAWSDQLAQAVAEGTTTVLWGAGSKAVSYLTTLGVGREVAGAVDINPYKQGKYLAGTGHPVLAPETLKALRPGLVIAMNGVYRDEIAQHLSRLGVDAELRTLDG